MKLTTFAGVFVCAALCVAAVQGGTTFRGFFTPVWKDCTGEGETAPGSYIPRMHSTYFNGTLFYTLIPTQASGDGAGKEQSFPVVAFMHGTTAQYEMYAPVLELYCSHGFVVVYPFIKDPKGDKNPLTTNTNGEYLIKALDFARQASVDPASPLHLVADPETAVIVGHSMGATCSIAAGHRLPAGTLKAVVTQHPGICGPFGPPPLPATWMPSQLADVLSKAPVLFTTATNDGAFWPAPHTATHEYNCFSKAVKDLTAGSAAFVKFSKDACAEDGARKPFKDEGHNCAFKVDVETPWVLRVLKLYAHMQGRSQSACHAMVWGKGPDSIASDPHVETVEIHAK